MSNPKEELKWRKLDNSAKIFPITSNKRFSTVFRLSVILKEEIEPLKLKQAVDRALQRFEFFKVRLRKGAFWYYFEYNPKEIVVEEESNYPCKYIDKNRNNGYLFKVTYFHSKINMDVFHSLTDGNSATQFFKEIVYNYIEIAHPEKFKVNLRSDKKITYNAEDSYMKNYDKKLKGKADGNKAYMIRGNILPLDAIGVTHVIIDLEELKKECQEKDITVTQYLTTVLIYSIYQENYIKSRDKKPIKICIPVNLRKYFPSSTISNFFSYITVVARMEKLTTFEAILGFVKENFKEKLEKEEIAKTMAANVKLGNNPFIRGVPLFLKRIAVGISYIEIRKYTTTTFSNIGRVGIIQEYKEFIDSFMMLIAPESVEKIKCSSCSYENKMVFTFTSILSHTKIESGFCRFLKARGIHVEIESNGVNDVIS